MYSFEGDFRRKPQQSLRGASKKEEKDSLLKRTQVDRQKRETFRCQNETAVKIQKVFRGYRVRKKQNDELRKMYDIVIQTAKPSEITVELLIDLTTQLCHFYRNQDDGSRLVWLSQHLIKQKDRYVSVLLKSESKGQQQIKNILHLCLRHLSFIADTAQSIAIPMRMLEIFTSSALYSSKPVILLSIWKYLLQSGYFDCMRSLLSLKVPSSLERSTIPPTPIAASIFDLIMAPIGFAASLNNRLFSNQVLGMVCRSLLCPVYTQQISQFLLPAMAYGKYPFPFVDLIQALILQTTGEKGSHKNQVPIRKGETIVIEASPWLLGAFLSLGDKYLEGLSTPHFCQYLQVIQWLIPLLPLSSNADTNDSDEDEDMDVTDYGENAGKMADLREDCLYALDNQALVQRTITVVSKNVDAWVIYAVSVICHCLMAHQKFSIHRRRLLYSLAFNPKFIRSLWRSCVSETMVTATRTKTELIMMLCRGLTMSERDTNRIVPLLGTFCAMFSHSLHTLHDADFYGENSDQYSSMPFNLPELVPMTVALRDVCLGIIELAHPDSKASINEDYRVALKRTGIPSRTKTRQEDTKQAIQWGYLFKVTAALVRQLYTRDSRRSFCPRDLWLSDRVKIQADGPSQIYRVNDAASVFTHRPFRTMQSLSRANDFDEEGGPPLSNRDVKNLVILTELPFVVNFQERVKILQKLTMKDKEENQGETHQFLSGPAITVTIRRNFIYEDAFEKLSVENEPNLKLKMRVQLVNAAGLDEAGIDGGGIFREFLNVLLKTGYDGNRGFFSQTTDNLLYPNPTASVIVDDFTSHYFFLGRMLGKALYENMLVELPFASFFLSKILSRHSGDLDIHHLASLDPEMYKNLLFLKHYEGDVSELGLDFTAVNNQFGETRIDELKPGGRNIAVTSNNRIEYIHLMADYKLNKQIRSHCMAFRQGLSDLINLEWLRMFDHHELQVLISGASIPVDIYDLKQHTHYSGGYNADHPVIKMFWRAVEEFTNEQKAQLLKFITSCSRPPLLGFKDLYPAFCIHYGGTEQDRLPTASTCMNLLKLPECKDETVLKEKLLYAIEAGAGFELS